MPKETQKKLTPQKGTPPQKKPKSKEDVIRRMVNKDPEKAAEMLRQILKKMG